MSYLNPHTHRLDSVKSLADLTAEIRANNIEKGHRPADGGPGGNTWGDYIALLHSEISEALEAYRDHRLEDATGGRITVRDVSDIGRVTEETRPPKPEGVGSEFADILIRFLDMCDVFGITPFDMDCALSDVSSIPTTAVSFGDHMAWLHRQAANIEVTWKTRDDLAAGMLRALATCAEKFGIDLAFEYERKIAYNRGRSFQHGGRTLSDTHS